VFAVVGCPVRRSLSPLMYNAALRAHGIDAVYVAFEVNPDRGDEVADALRTLGVAGANLTVPFKERVMPYLDRLAPSAVRAGSVNTVVSEAGELVGHNTDGDGLLDHMDHLGRPPVRHAVVVGAGGTGRAVSAALTARGATVQLLNRTLSRASAVSAVLDGVQPGPLTPVAFADAAAAADLVVHCTADPAAMAPLDPVGFRGHTWVDVNYWQRDTPHRAALVARGVEVVDGLGMLAFQGARALSLFTGVAVPGADLLATLMAQR
jgi:shikimate dehydrogenase